MWNIARLLPVLVEHKLGWAGLDVTDTPERAWRYANAQATGVVDPCATSPAEAAAIVEIDVADDLRWIRRPENHPSLDQAEALLEDRHTYKVARVLFRPTAYRNSDCALAGRWGRAITEFCEARRIPYVVLRETGA